MRAIVMHEYMGLLDLGMRGAVTLAAALATCRIAQSP